MKIHVKYFGVIAEKTGRKEEKLELKPRITLSEFNDFIINKYHLNGIPFRIALNENFEDNSTFIKKLDKVVLLPPFAGG